LNAINFIFNFLASRWLTLVLMGIAAAAMAVITVCEAREGSGQTPFRYYFSPAFLLLLIAVWINLLANMVQPGWWRFRRLPLSLSHLGFFLILTGGYLTWTLGIRGNLSIMEGESLSAFQVEKPVLQVTGPDLPEPACYMIEDGERLRGGGFFPALNPLAAKSRVTIDDGRTVAILESMESSRVKIEVREAAEGEGPPALVLGLETRFEEQVILQDGETVQLNHPAVSNLVFFHLAENEAADELISEIFGEWIQIKPPEGKGEKIFIKTPDCMGRTFTLGEYTVKVLEYHPDFKMGQTPDLDAEPRNPALRLEVSGPAGSDTIYTFAFFEFHGNRLADGTEILYRRPAEGDTVLLRADGPERIEAYIAGDEEPVLVSLEKPLVLGPENDALSIKPKALWPSSRTEERIVMDRTGKGPPAYQVQVGEDAEPAWLRPGKGQAVSSDGALRAFVVNRYPLGFSLTLDDAVAEYWPVSSIPKAYYSHVRIADYEGKTFSPARIETNAPLYRNGFRLYQSGMDESAPYRYSVFSVARDPGVGVVTLGFLTMTAGMLWLYWKRFVLKPLRQRKEGA
jgi:hypothetical protein